MFESKDVKRTKKVPMVFYYLWKKWGLCCGLKRTNIMFKPSEEWRKWSVKAGKRGQTSRDQNGEVPPMVSEASRRERDSASTSSWHEGPVKRGWIVVSTWRTSLHYRGNNPEEKWLPLISLAKNNMHILSATKLMKNLAQKLFLPTY